MSDPDLETLNAARAVLESHGYDTTDIREQIACAIAANEDEVTTWEQENEAASTRNERPARYTPVAGPPSPARLEESRPWKHR